jgi:eukaryotic-like serine/threonine-protein kinase
LSQEPIGRGPSTAGGAEPSAVQTTDEPEPVGLPAWPERGLGAAATAVLATWMLGHVLGSSPIAPVAGGLIAAGAVLAMPRIGWFVVSFALALAAVAGGHAGSGLVFAAAALVPIVTMFGAGVAWPLAVAAPLLGAVGLGGAWPALAARSKSIRRRAALGLTGWIWLLLASTLAGKGLYLRLLPGTPARGVFGGSLFDAIHHVLGPVVTSGALAVAPLWALAAVVLPYLVTGRSAAVDVVRVVIWAAVLASGTTAVLTSVHVPHGVASPPTAVIGALAGAVVALAPTAIAVLRPVRNSSRLVS